MQTACPLLAAALTGQMFICVLRLNLLCSNLHLLCLTLLRCTAVNPRSSGSTPSNASQKAAGHLCCQGTAGSHSSHCPLDPQAFVHRVVLQLSVSRWCHCKRIFLPKGSNSGLSFLSFIRQFPRE